MLRDGGLVSRRLVREMVRIACDRGDRTTVQRARCHPPPRYINRDRSTEGSRGPPESRSYDRRRRKLGRQASDRVRQAPPEACSMHTDPCRLRDDLRWKLRYYYSYFAGKKTKA